MNIRRLVSLVALVVLEACGSSSTDGGSQPTYSVDVTPASIQLTLFGASASGTVNAIVTRKLGANAVVDNTSPVAWTTGDPAVATVAGSGRSATVTGTGHGTTTVAATSGGGNGSASVSVTAPNCTFHPDNLLITAGTTVTGTLSAAKCRYSDAPAVFYNIEITSSQFFSFDLTATGFLPTLTLFDEKGVSVTSHKPSTGNTARVTRVLMTPGTHRVVVGAASPSASGSYSLSVTASAATACNLSTPISTIVPATVPSTTSGTLAATDCRLLTGYFADLYRVTVSESTNVQFDLTSSAFNAWLDLLDANGVVIVFDNDSGGGTNSRITRVLGPGTYYIAANSLNIGETGAYGLTVKIP